MSIELVCDSCGKRLKQSSSGMIPLDSQEWAEIEVRPPRKVEAKEKFSELICVPLAPRYTVCSAQCAHKVLDRIGKELDDAFKSATGMSDKR